MPEFRRSAGRVHVQQFTSTSAPGRANFLQEAETAQGGGMGRLSGNNSRLQDAGVSWQPSHSTPIQAAQHECARIVILTSIAMRRMSETSGLQT